MRWKKLRIYKSANAVCWVEKEILEKKEEIT